MNIAPFIHAEKTSKKIVFMAIAVAIGSFFATATAQGDYIIERLKKGDNLKLAAIGTSLTDASVNAPNWFAQMGAWLSTTYPGQVTLSDRAVSGMCSVNLPQFGRPYGGPWQLDQVLANDNPDAIFIEFAINDAYEPFNISPADSANNLGALIDQIKTWASNNSKNVDIVVQTMNNTGPSTASTLPNLGLYYQAWRDEAAANHALLIDHYPNWLNLYNSEPDHATWMSYVPDDIHPTAAGATDVILPEIQRALNAQTPEPSSAVLLLTLFLGLLCGVRLFLPRECPGPTHLDNLIERE